MILENKKLPKSNNGKQCITKCFKPNSIFLHPVTLKFINSGKNAVCAVNEYIDNNNGKDEKHYADMCNPQLAVDIQEGSIENFISPLLDFNSSLFLLTFYDIKSLEDALDWIDKNSHLPIYSKKRILDLSIEAFGTDINIVDNRFIDIVLLLVKTIFLEKFKDRLLKYIYIDSKGLVQLTRSKASKSDDKDNVIKINYMFKMLVNSDEILKFSIKYFRSRKSEWSNISDHLTNYIDDFILYLINKINLSLDTK